MKLSYDEVQSNIDNIYGIGEWEVIRYLGSHQTLVIRHKCGLLKSITKATNVNLGTTRCICTIKNNEVSMNSYIEQRLHLFDEINEKILKLTDEKFELVDISPKKIKVIHKKCDKSTWTTELEFFNNINCKYCEKEESWRRSYEKQKEELRKKASERKTRDITFTNNIKKEFKNKHGKLYCQICEFSFGDRYGTRAEDYIEAHHIIPFSKLSKDQMKNKDNIILLCANCHQMMHKRKLSIKELKELIKK
ncbi:HNH endonuclease [Paraclostridium bifermentans]|uniref:HNH endonuclease n=1 Tax=Paraclostridium bifermentans TaxID=1490 RepID=UPI0018984AE0|nr:HNH endonuclease [Paraclostridium bifermentans]